MSRLPSLTLIEQVVVTSVLHQLRAGYIESGAEEMTDVQKIARMNLEHLFVNNQVPWAGQC